MDAERIGNRDPRLGRRVYTIADLRDLAMKRRSIICPHYGPARKPTPAAWAFSWQGPLIWMALEAGMFVYRPKALGTCDGDHGGPRCRDPECWHQ